MDFEKIKLIPAEEKNDDHKKGVWHIYNENLEYNLLNKKKVSYENHCRWWTTAFKKEYIYLIIKNEKILGYIRITKFQDNVKNSNEISIALLKKYQGLGIGSFAYKLFEEKIKKKGINTIAAIVLLKNKGSQNFFLKNNFIKKKEPQFYVINNYKEPYFYYIKKI